jgi:long-subunit acyl-CoA synthetase (AMP-forming)
MAHPVGFRPVASAGSTAPGAAPAKPTYGPYKWYSYAQVGKTVANIGAGLEARNLTERNDTGLRCVGIYSKTRVEMMIAEMALMRQVGVLTRMSRCLIQTSSAVRSR